MGHYRKKPLEIEAFRFEGGEESAKAIIKWAGDSNVEWNEAAEPWQSEDGRQGHSGWPEQMRIQTLEGTMYADIGDYIIKGIKGEFYPCKPDIFLDSYEEVEVPVNNDTPLFSDGD